MFGAKNFDPNDSYLQSDELHTYLSNRKHLDFALKLALGSQAYLHDISSINQGSNMSFDSVQKRISPMKSVDGSISKRPHHKNKPSPNQEKQNIIKIPQFRSQQKITKIHNSEQQTRHFRHKLQSIQVWIEFINERCKMGNDIAGSRLAQKAPKEQKMLSKQKINEFFRQVVLKLQKLQIIQKHQYNAKLLICQLTEATLRENELQQKIRVLRKDVDEKKTLIQEQEQIIVKLLNGRKFEREQFLTTIKKQPGSKMSASQSLLKYSLSEGQQANTIAKKVRFFELGENMGQIPSQMQKNQFKQQKNYQGRQESGMHKNFEYQFCQSPIKMKANNNFVYETPNQESFLQNTVPKYDVQTPTVKDIKRASQKTIGFKKTDNDEKQLENQKSQEESILLSCLSGSIKKVSAHFRKPTIEQTMEGNENYQNLLNQSGQQDKIDQQYEFGKNSIRIQNNSPYSHKSMCQCQKISDSAMLQIREEVERLIGENNELKQKINLLQIQLFSHQQKQNKQQMKQYPKIGKRVQANQIQATVQVRKMGSIQKINQIEQSEQILPIQYKNCPIKQNGQDQSLQKDLIQTNELLIPKEICVHCRQILAISIKHKRQETANQLKLQKQRILQIQQNQLGEESNLLATYKNIFNFRRQAQITQLQGRKGDKTEVSTKVNDKTIQNRQVLSSKSLQNVSNQYKRSQQKSIQTDQNHNNFDKKHFFKAKQQQFGQIFNQDNQNKQDIKNYQFSQFQKQQNDQSNLLENSPCNAQQKQHNLANTWKNYSSQAVLNKRQPKLKRQTTESSSELKQAFLLLVQNNKNLLQKLRMKKFELKQIKEIIRQAKRINEEDMQRLQTIIINREVRRSREISELKQMEFKWNNEFKEARSKKIKKIQILNAQLELKVNPKIFKFNVSKSENVNA